MTKSIAVGSDDAGFGLKEEVKKYLESEGHIVTDYGCPAREGVDYSDVALLVADAVARGEHDRAILVCGTGIGMAISANKVPGVYAAVAHDAYSAAKARTSNNTQVLALGARVVAPELATTRVGISLRSQFGRGPYARRGGKIEQAEHELGRKPRKPRSK